MNKHTMRNAYFIMIFFIAVMGLLLSPLFSGPAKASSPLELSIGQARQLNTTLSNAEWTSTDPTIVEVDDQGRVYARGVGFAEISAVSGNKMQHRMLLVRAPEKTPGYTKRSSLLSALAASATKANKRFTFRLQLDAPERDDEITKKSISKFFPAPDEFFIAYCRELRFNFIWSYSGKDKVIIEATCTFTYAASSEVAAAYRGESVKLSGEAKILKNKCDKIISDLGLRKMKTRYERVLAVHDYIVKNASYHKAAVGNNVDYPDSFSATGVLIHGEGVCQSYAEAMKLLLNAVNVNCDYVVGYANENHVWNRVQLDDGNWYNVDATWDDPMPDRGDNVSHRYFCITDEQLEKTHTWTDYTHACKSTKYSYDNILKLLAAKKAA